MSQTLLYDNTGTDNSSLYQIYDLDFFPGGIWDLEEAEIDQINLDLEKMVVYVVTSDSPGTIKIEGEIKIVSQNWGSGIAISDLNIVNEDTISISPSLTGLLKSIQIEGLSTNTKYDFRIRAANSSNAAVYGNYIYATFTTIYPIGENGLAKIQSFTNPSLLAPVISDQVVNKNINTPWTPWNYEEEKEFWKQVTPVKPITELTSTPNTITSDNKKISGSVFTVSNPLYKITPVILCTKSTDIDLQYGSPTYDPLANPPIVYPTYKHFAFGTKLFFSEWKERTEAPKGGMAFFLTPSGSYGYAVVIQTTESTATDGSKELSSDVSIVKIESTNKFKKLSDNQGALSSSFSGITSAEEYRIDIYVDCSNNTKTYIYAYINGKKITAVDDSSPHQPTKNIGLFSMKGECNFDYVYAYPLFQNQFDSITPDSFLLGKAPFSALSIAYGEKLINLNSQEYNGYYEEFGPTAKEIMLIEEKFNQPGIPKYLSTGINDYVQILSEKKNNFGFKAYIINNSSATIPIANEQDNVSLSVIGNSIVIGEKTEYNTDLSDKYINDEPIILEASWIQRKSDAEKMANWLKQQWSKNSIYVTMQVFGNPFIAIGDIVTITYPRSGVYGTEKFLVTYVEQSFDGGLETTIGCRSINSYS